MMVMMMMMMEMMMMMVDDDDFYIANSISASCSSQVRLGTGVPRYYNQK